MKDIRVEKSQTRDFASEIINKKRDISKESKVPQVILIISWIYILGAILSLLGGIFVIFISSSFTGGIYNPVTGVVESLFGFLTRYFIVLGIFLILLSPFFFFVARGLKKAKKWARIGAIFLALLGLVMSVITLIQGNYFASSLRLIFFGYIAGYLLLTKEVKEFFS